MINRAASVATNTLSTSYARTSAPISKPSVNGGCSLIDVDGVDWSLQNQGILASQSAEKKGGVHSKKIIFSGKGVPRKFAIPASLMILPTPSPYTIPEAFLTRKGREARWLET